MDRRSDGFLLENQLCFPLYAAARGIIKRYRPFLDEVGLTYTQYIVMLVFWERGTVTAKELGRLLHLDSGTLTPVLKSLETKGLVRRARSRTDERVLVVEITENGRTMKENAVAIPGCVARCLPLDTEESSELRRLLLHMLDLISTQEN